MPLSLQEKKIILLAQQVREKGEVYLEGGGEIWTLRNKFYALRRRLEREDSHPKILEELLELTFSDMDKDDEGIWTGWFRLKLPIDPVLDKLLDGREWQEEPGEKAKPKPHGPISLEELLGQEGVKK